ncbi:acyltransferase family protein [Bacteroides faecium]|uniref:Acyltransferase n=1 Tax=Bacteroides faecium TaxID=2715212 RepID=A0A6H0KNV3_9BACE|nr:acyltransferase family protein [Bacteroides faecium]QIU95144.1 acyltransferase [Bacteroides faecium]
MAHVKKKRIEYIDYLRGLTVMWVVWYHAKHPDFVDYSFRIPLFYFISGIFFKLYDIPVFLKKKINQIVIPFIFFYLLYYLFYLFLNYCKYKDLYVINYAVIGDLFNPYVGTESFTINPPLWFLCGLINLQLLLYVFRKYISNVFCLLLIASIISLLGMFVIQDVPTYFMFGRCLRYFIYYVIGFVVGKTLLEYINERKHEILLLLLSVSVFLLGVFAKSFLAKEWELELFDMINIFSLIFIMIVLMKNMYKYKIMYIFKFFGMNSIIVLGFHEIIQTCIKIIINWNLGETTIFGGALETIMTLVLLYPCIIIMNKHIPMFVAKKEFCKI